MIEIFLLTRSRDAGLNAKYNRRWDEWVIADDGKSALFFQILQRPARE
jgi:hypothetical protein